MRIRIEPHKPIVMRRSSDLLTRLLQVRQRQARGRAEIVAVLVVAYAQHGAVGGEQDRFAACGFGAADDPFLHVLVAHRVELDGVVDGSHA